MNHKESSFKGLLNFNIYCQSWLPDKKAKAILLIAHGYAEHSGRYGNLVDYFVPQGFAVYALDHRGHGKSDGERVQVNDFHDYIVDLKTYFDIIRKENPNSKIFLVGHSMGSIISQTYTLEYQHELAGLIISSGGLIRPEDPPMAPPKGAALSASVLSRDPAVVAAYINDPLVYHGPIPQNHAMRGRMAKLAEVASNIKLPILIMAGTGGADGARCKTLFDLVGSPDKTYIPYAGLLHEIFNEPEHLQVFSDMHKWINAHL
jgi:alpha-beta hydrolase superfamily lysophospholipase